MKSFVKGLWSRTKSEPKTRALNRPEDLQIGDMVQLSDSFGLPKRLRDQMFKVIGLVTYQFEHQFSTSFSLEGTSSNDHIDLTIDREEGRAVAAFSLSVDRSVVEQVFDLEEFSLIFDSDDPAQVSPVASLDMDGWLAETYHQEAKGERGYYYQKDYRERGPPEYEGEGEAFDYYFLATPDGNCGIEIEVFEGGETEVSLTLYRPIDDIKELWPASA